MKKLTFLICVMLMTAVGAFSKDLLKASKRVETAKAVVPQGLQRKATPAKAVAPKVMTKWGEGFASKSDFKAATKKLGRPAAMPAKNIAPLAASANAFEAKETQMWWGYVHSKDLGDPTKGIWSVPSKMIDVAIYVPDNHGYAGNSTIQGIRLWLDSDIDLISKLIVWISKAPAYDPEDEEQDLSEDLPGDYSEADYMMEVPMEDLQPGMNDIELDKPYEVEGGAFYVGYTVVGKSSEDRISIVSTEPYDEYGEEIIGGYYFHYLGSDSWMDFASWGWGALAIQVLLDGGDYPEANQAITLDYGQEVVLKDESKETTDMSILIYNAGRNDIKNVSYIITDGGTASEEKSIELDNLQPGDYAHFSIPFQLDKNVGKVQKTLTITKVNGVEQTGDNYVSNGYLITLDTQVPTVPVVESFTGTWDPLAPYGLKGLEKAQEQYGDKVIYISSHVLDPMDAEYDKDEPEGYYPLWEGLSLGSLGYGLFTPKGYINRSLSMRLYNSFDYYYDYSYLLPDYLEYFDIPSWPAQGSIEATATWANEEKTAIDIATATKFGYGENDGQYGIAYVLLEDGLTGEDEDWQQSNWFPAILETFGEEFFEGIEDMMEWAETDEYVTMTYDNVAVGAWGVEEGVEGSVSPAITANQAQNFLFKADIDGNPVIQNKENLKVVALLLDNINGTIVNAAQVKITDGSVTPQPAVGDVNGDGQVNSGDVQRVYSLMAQSATAETNPEADVNKDGQVNSGDIQRIYGIMATQSAK